VENKKRSGLAFSGLVEETGKRNVFAVVIDGEAAESWISVAVIVAVEFCRVIAGSNADPAVLRPISEG